MNEYSQIYILEGQKEEKIEQIKGKIENSALFIEQCARKNFIQLFEAFRKIFGIIKSHRISDIRNIYVISISCLGQHFMGSF